MTSSPVTAVQVEVAVLLAALGSAGVACTIFAEALAPTGKDAKSQLTIFVPDAFEHWADNRYRRQPPIGGRKPPTRPIDDNRRWPLGR